MELVLTITPNDTQRFRDTVTFSSRIMKFSPFFPWLRKCTICINVKWVVNGKQQRIFEFEIWIALKDKVITDRYQTATKHKNVPFAYYSAVTSHELHSVSNRRQLSCLLNSSLWVITMKTSKLSATSSLWGESCMAGRFPQKGPLMQKSFSCHELFMFLGTFCACLRFSQSDTGTGCDWRLII